MRHPVVVLGEFDGFHLGHRQLIDAARRVAEEHSAPLVAVVMHDLGQTERLGTLTEACRAILSAGASAVHIVDVDTRHAESEAERLVRDVSMRMDPVAVVMACLPGGERDARFPSLRKSLAAAGILQLDVQRWAEIDGLPITGRHVREALEGGDVLRAANCLGRPYALTGQVVHGSGLGRTIGFPTANVWPPEGRVIPAKGVYAASVTTAAGRTRGAAVNIGERPTVEVDGRLLIEAHLLDFDEDIYDTRITIEFLRWLRGEQRFGSVDELITQLELDVVRARIATE